MAVSLVRPEEVWDKLHGKVMELARGCEEAIIYSLKKAGAVSNQGARPDVHKVQGQEVLEDFCRKHTEIVQGLRTKPVPGPTSSGQ